MTTGKAVNYEYDSLGRLIHSYQTNGDTVNHRSEHLYDTENRLTRFSYSIPGVIDSASESFTYNTDTSDSVPTGSLTSMAMFNNSWINYRYDSLARLKERDVGNLLTEYHTYQAGSTTGTTTMRPETFYTTAKGSSTKLTGFQYTYDAVGNITKTTNQVDKSYWGYSYDSLGQLRYATDYQSNGTANNRYKYYYDNAGNLTSWKIQDDSGTTTKASHTYTYGDSDWLDLLTAFDGQSITYDGAGNPLSYYNGSRYTMTWQNGRQLASATVGGKTYSYEYNSNGIRTRKTNYDGGYTEYYVVEGMPVAEQRFKSNGTKQYILRYLYDESNSPVGFGIYYPTASSPYWQYYYFGKNIQGDVIALYRSDYNSTSKSYTPTLVATYTYDPWGAPTGIYSASGATISQTASNVAAYNPFRYRGYRYDGDTRLYYLQNRYYDPAIGRFINADGYVSTGQGLIGHNMFAYCNNTPIVMEDTAGKIPNYCIAVSDGAAGASPSNYKPKPKADKVLQEQKPAISKKFGISIPGNSQIHLTVGEYVKTPESVFADKVADFIIEGGMSAAAALFPWGPKVVFLHSVIKKFKPDHSIHDPGTYKTYTIVIEYDVVDSLTNTNIHYIDSYLFARIYDQTGAPNYILWEKETVNIYGG